MSGMVSRITIAGEIYSPNLGDGMIYESLAYLFQQQTPSIVIQPLDISGRSNWSQTSKLPLKTRLTSIGRRWLPGLSRWINVVTFGMQYLNRLQSKWQRILEQTDLLVIGGGQLLMDNYLDFPVKLLFLSRLADRLHVPIHLVGVGVGDRWSQIGLAWAKEVVRSAVSISVRDAFSLSILTQIFQRQDAYLTADPAFWAKEIYGVQPEPVKKKIGLGMLNYTDFHAHDNARSVSASQWLEYWENIAMGLYRQGMPVEIFTNGNLLDEEFAHRVYRRVNREAQGLIVKAERARHTRALAWRIGGYRAILSARYHANILAAIYGVPAIGFVWDKKVSHLYQSMGYGERLIRFAENSVLEVVEKIRQLNHSLPENIVERNKELVARDIARVMT